MGALIEGQRAQHAGCLAVIRAQRRARTVECLHFLRWRVRALDQGRQQHPPLGLSLQPGDERQSQGSAGVAPAVACSSVPGSRVQSVRGKGRDVSS